MVVIKVRGGLGYALLLGVWAIEYLLELGKNFWKLTCIPVLEFVVVS